MQGTAPINKTSLREDFLILLWIFKRSYLVYTKDLQLQFKRAC